MELYLTYHKVLDKLQAFQENYCCLNSFGYGNLVDFGKNVSGQTVSYPYLFVVPASISYDQNTTTYQLSCIFADRLNESLDNEKDAVSDMSLAARQLLSEIWRGNLQDYFDAQLPVNAQPFMERFNDYVAGVALDLSLTVMEDINACPQWSVTPVPPQPTVTPTVTPSPTPCPSFTTIYTQFQPYFDGTTLGIQAWSGTEITDSYATVPCDFEFSIQLNLDNGTTIPFISTFTAGTDNIQYDLTPLLGGLTYTSLTWNDVYFAQACGCFNLEYLDLFNAINCSNPSDVRGVFAPVSWNNTIRKIDSGLSCWEINGLRNGISFNFYPNNFQAGDYTSCAECLNPTPTPSVTPTMTLTPTVTSTPTQTPTIPLTPHNAFIVGTGTTSNEACQNLANGNTIIIYANVDLSDCAGCAGAGYTCFPCVQSNDMWWLDAAFTIPAPDMWLANYLVQPNSLPVRNQIQNQMNVGGSFGPC